MMEDKRNGQDADLSAMEEDAVEVAVGRDENGAAVAFVLDFGPLAEVQPPAVSFLAEGCR